VILAVVPSMLQPATTASSIQSILTAHHPVILSYTNTIKLSKAVSQSVSVVWCGREEKTVKHGSNGCVGLIETVLIILSEGDGAGR
jgi:hypothetical protein